MNIKGLTPSLVHLDQRLRPEASQDVRLKNSSDRDPNGRREQPEPEIKRHLTEEELEDALKVIKANPGVVSNNLQIRIEMQDDHRVIYVEDLSGKIIRRLSEADLWLATREKDRPIGQLLDKAG